MTLPFPFDGFGSPHYTQVPDELFDYLAPHLSEAELRVLLYIVRRTFGFKKDADDISLSQLVEGIRAQDGRVLDYGTGLTRKSVIKGLKGLAEKGIIVARRNQSQARGFEATTYTLKFRDSPWCTTYTSPSEPPPPALGDVVHLQETDVQQTAEQETDFEIRNSKSTRPGNSSRARDAPEPPTRDGHRMSLEERAAWEERMDAQEAYLRSLRPKPAR